MMGNIATEVNPGAAWRKHGLFSSSDARAILRRCPVRRITQRPLSPNSLKRCSVIPGRPRRPPKHDLSTWTVTDDWPERVPVTEAEVEVFEQWFADLFDELFGSAP